MAQENLNTSTPNSGLGDFLRDAFIKVQNMFTDLYTNKVDKEIGKGLSKNDFTDILKGKLDGIASFAEVNVQSDWNQADNTQDDFIKNKPSIPVLSDYVLNGGYTGTAQDLANLITNTPIPFTGADLVSDGFGLYKLPITLSSEQGVVWIKVIKGGVTYLLPVQYENGFLLNFDDNTTQNIKVKIS